MANAALRTQLFRFVDALPAMADDADLYRHVEEYFGGEVLPGLFAWGLTGSGRVPGGRKVVARIARREVAKMATQFIVATDAQSTATQLEDLWRRGRAATVDLLGEHTHSHAEADRYTARLADLVSVLIGASRQWPANEVLERDDLGALGRVAVAIKPTALAPDFAALTSRAGISSATRRLMPILEDAAEGAQVWFDLERYDVKHVTHRLVRELLDRPELAALQAGIVVQTYLRDSYEDLARLCEWAAGRETPFGIRLVKGAYWDTETVVAEAASWPVPVYELKAETDANFERCVRLVHTYHGRVRAAFGSHNLRSLAYAIAAGRAAGIPDNGYEVQLLWGMAEPVHEAFRQLGFRLRVYTPMGELVPGMAYLVRRLLENTSNESFVRLRFAEHKELDSLVAAPKADLDALSVAGLNEPVVARPLTEARKPAPYAPEPLVRWFAPGAPKAMAAALETVRASLGAEVPGLIGGTEVRTRRTIVSVDPAEPARVVAVSACCGLPEADRAVEVALSGFEAWSRATMSERAAVLFRAADWLRRRKLEIAALEVFEAGKCWDDADADVAEAIDFLEYYGREGLRLAGGGQVQSSPGEVNRLSYHGRGVAAVISPWNFPLAIPTGMVGAALVCGNTVVLKPAEQTPAIAEMLVRALSESGLPQGVLSFLPGLGEEIGAHLVTHRDVSLVVFTGSKDVGLAIVESAARTAEDQREIRRVVAELGGKNALIIDSDADLDEAVPAAIRSVFGFAGQRCSAASRIVTVGGVHDMFLERFVEAARSLAIGPPSEQGTELGPVIDEDSVKRIRGWQDRAEQYGRVVLRRDDLPVPGYFVGPTIVDDAVPGSPLVTEEIFGPVAAVLPARDFDHALELANQTSFALTAGIVSRSPSHIERASAYLRGGNIYVNRAITGAVVGRQPFGGHGMSGIGSKAGGPDYLLQFMRPRVVTENTLRQGFAPPADQAAT
jgi:RHH-type proline utilization regulon transcriptional repressor/proline dehydrogenase/delta 1-pyrroline-5-carboxylate dehydrogenase